MRHIKNWIFSKSIYQQLAALAVITAAAIGVFLGFAINFASKEIYEKNISYADSLQFQLENTVRSHYNTYTKIIRLISYNNDVQHFLLAEDDSERYDLYSSVLKNLSDFSNLDSGILDVILVDAQGQRYSLVNNIIYEIPSTEGLDDTTRISPLQEVTVSSQSVFYQVISKKIYSIDSYVQTNKLIGTLHLILSPTAFTGEEDWDSVQEGIELYLTDNKKQVIWKNGTSKTERNVVFPTTFTYSDECTVGSTGLTVSVYLLSNTFFWSELNFQTAILFGIIFLLFLLTFIWVLYARNIVRPLRKLSRFLENIHQPDPGIFERKIYLDGYRESVIIGNEINQMLSTIQNLTNDLVEKNTALYKSQLLSKQAELSHLRSQINPHFLYNTLETMVGIAYTESQPHLAEIARALSLIFKYSIKGNDTVSLNNELKIVKNYIFIQKVRFADRFDVEYNVDPQCLKNLIPKMIFQPLIENAVVHGIEGCDRFCHLYITAQHKGEHLILSVEDDGAGILPDKLQELHSLMESPDSMTQTAHIGLINVHHRIRLIFGEPYGLRIESSAESGTRVFITLPILSS